MEDEDQKQQAQVTTEPRPLRPFRVFKKVMLGPDPPKVTAYGGVVPTRGEVQEELRTRLEFGVGKN